MSRIYIKICGLTTPQDAAAACAAGVDAVGLVFVEGSPRRLSAEAAREILDVLPPFIKTIGLFADAAEEAVLEVLDKAPLDMLQFHGGESADDCLRHARPYIKAVAMGAENVDLTALAKEHSGARGLLLDAHDIGELGGSGESFDWGRLPPLEEGALAGCPLILAGGLNAENVAEAIRRTGVRAVDVSSGVEVPGRPERKDPERMRRFVAAAQGAML